MFDNNYTWLLNLNMHEISEDEKRQVSKFIDDIKYNARANLLKQKCFVCKKGNNSCNSHFVPKSYLKNIADNGKIYLQNIMIDIPSMDTDSGLNNAGTFHLICRKCDGELFSEYENFDYKRKPNNKILSQIALKNYLKFIYKTKLECEYWKKVKNRIGSSNFIEEELKIAERNLHDYICEYKNIKLNQDKRGRNDYNLFYFHVLDYIVPIAFQSIIVLIADMNGRIINNVYNDSKKYNLESLNICIFPLKGRTAIILFHKKQFTRYQEFVCQFNKLNENDKLSLINFIIFQYSEDIFISKKINDEVLNNQSLINTAKSTLTSFSTICDTYERQTALLELAKNNFNLKKHSTIPNLLDEKFKI